MTRNVPWSPHRYDSIERMNDIAGPGLSGLEQYSIAATKALYGSRISNSQLLKHSRNTSDKNRRSSASINMLSAVPSHTYDTDGTEHSGQVRETTLNHLTDRGADGRSLDGLRRNDGKRKNNESGTLEGETHSTKKRATRGMDWKLSLEEEEFYWKMLMEEALEAFSFTTISSRGPNHGIAGDDMRIISDGNQETQSRRNDRDNNDTQSNGRRVTNGYAFGSDMDRLTETPD